MYIKDTYTGNVRKYGSDQHDSLRISNDGTCLTYEHLQCGDGSIEGDKEHSGFLFCDDEGRTPEEDEVLCSHGADAFFNIGGWKEPPKWIPVSERLPKPYTYVNATCRSLVDDRENWVIETMYLPIPKENNEQGYSDWGNIPMLNWHKAEVIAWMERKIPEPYKESEET